MPSATPIRQTPAATNAVPPIVTSVERNEPPPGSARSAVATRSRTPATNQIRQSSPRPASTQPMLTCERLPPLEYQSVILAGDESDGPSNRKIAPITTSTTKAIPPRLDQTRKRAVTDPSSVRPAAAGRTITSAKQENSIGSRLS